MSATLYIQGLTKDGLGGLTVSAVLDALGATADADNNGFYRAQYGAESSVDIALQVFAGKAVYVTIFRPVSADFWSGVFRLLTEGPYLAYMPGSKVVTASQRMQSAMPTDMS